MVIVPREVCGVATTSPARRPCEEPLPFDESRLLGDNLRPLANPDRCFHLLAAPPLIYAVQLRHAHARQRWSGRASLRHTWACVSVGLITGEWYRRGSARVWADSSALESTSGVSGQRGVIHSPSARSAGAARRSGSRSGCRSGAGRRPPRPTKSRSSAGCRRTCRRARSRRGRSGA